MQKTVNDDEVIFDGKSLLMAFGNGNFYGGGYNCTPCADVSDGLIDYQIIKKVSVITFAALIGKFKKGLIYGNSKYNRIAKFGKGKKIVVESPKTLKKSASSYNTSSLGIFAFITERSSSCISTFSQHSILFSKFIVLQK